MSSALLVNGLGKSYGDVVALDDVTLRIAADQYVSLLGPSGSGKTTLLRLIAGFEEPDAGDVTVAGVSLHRAPAHRRGIGFVFQNFALFPHLTVEENIGFGLLNREEAPLAPRLAEARVREIIGLVGLTGLGDRRIDQISGGQRQRVALARTLVTEPKLVLLDEPLGALDANLRARMRSELRAIRERLGVTFLHVTGSETEALAMGDTVVVLDTGRVAQVGDPGTVYDRPATPNVARFLSCYNLFDGTQSHETFSTATGRFPTAGAVRQGNGGRREEAYAVRYDRIVVRPADAGSGSDEVRIEATFVASEYTGASVTSFFALDDGGMVEVEAHLSHRAPPAYAERQRYGLVWRPQDAIVFA